MERNHLLFLIAFVVSVGFAYIAIDQAYETGRVVSSRSVSNSCFDSDNGLNYDVAGYVQYLVKQGSSARQTRRDSCVNNSLLEGYCGSGGGGFAEKHLCPYGCKNGACLKSDRSVRYREQPQGGYAVERELSVGGSVYVFERNLTLRNVGVEGSALVDVDGASDVISNTSKTVNGLSLSVMSYNYSDVKSDRFVVLGVSSVSASSEVCVDSDGGTKPYVKGVASREGRTGIDFCEIYGGTGWAEVKSCSAGQMMCSVREKYCGNDQILALDYSCLNGCKDGACIPDECADSDAGMDIFTKGYVSTPNGTYYDKCDVFNQSIDEFYCAYGSLSEYFYKCQNGCENGACVNESMYSCADSDGEDTSKRGNVVYVNGTLNESYIDYCYDNQYLYEYICSDGEVLKKFSKCFYGCENGVCINQTGNACVDSDNGPDYYIKGTAETTNQIKSDYCASYNGSTVVNEYYCEDNVIKSSYFVCLPQNGSDYACNNGACVPQFNNANNTVRVCDDSDGGLNLFAKGFATEDQKTLFTDFCDSDSKVREYACWNNRVEWGLHPCEYGCKDGACMSKPEYKCIDSDGGLAYYTKGNCNLGDDTLEWDHCLTEANLPNSVHEHLCREDNKCYESEFACPNGCKDGACIRGPPTPYKFPIYYLMQSYTGYPLNFFVKKEDDMNKVSLFKDGVKLAETTDASILITQLPVSLHWPSAFSPLAKDIPPESNLSLKVYFDNHLPKEKEFVYQRKINSDKPAKGSINLLVVLMSNSPSYKCSIAGNKGNLEILKGDVPKYYKSSFKYIGDFFNLEASRITGVQNLVGIDIETVGPVGYNPQYFASTLYNESLTGSISSVDYLKGVLSAKGVDTNDVDAVAFVVIMNRTELDKIGGGKLPRANDFRSLKTSLQYMSSDTCPNYSGFHLLSSIIAHEILHTFGANDKYEGFKDLDSSYVPEGKHSVMGADGWPLPELAISQATADEIGWRDDNKNGKLDVFESGYFIAPGTNAVQSF